MHVRVRQCGKPEAIVVVNSKLTKIDEFRRLVHDKFGIEPNAQRLFYGGKVARDHADLMNNIIKTNLDYPLHQYLTLLAQDKIFVKQKLLELNSDCLTMELENGYSFHDYNIKLNDVIQLMIKVVQPDENSDNAESSDKREGKKDNTADKEDLKYDDAVSKFYQIGDLVDIRERLHGAWFEGKIVRIVRDPEYVDTSTQQQNGESSKHFDTNTSPKKSPTKVSKRDERKTENSPNSSKVDDKSEDSEGSPKTPKRRKGITDYFNRTPKSSTKNDPSKSHDKNSYTNGKKEITTKEPQLNTDVGLLYKVHFEEEDDSSAQYCKLEEVRPRARTCIAVEDLKVGQKVMVNHNTEELHEKGYWYDFTITEVKKLRKNYELIGTLYLGSEGVPQSDTKVRVNDKIYKIEQVIPLNERSEEEQSLMITSTEKRPGPLNCTRCRDNAESLCKECGCFLCAGKQDPDKIILCDECNNGYHMFCLTPTMEQLPEEDWYCPDCKRDANSVIAPGAAKQAKKSNQAKNSRDWGRGMACVGKTQTCSMPANHFGPIPGVEVGMAWRFRIQLSESGVHRPPVSGIHGRDVEGAYSLVLSGGYEDDVDNGFEFTYTGSGGRDLSGNKRTADQSSDQTLTRENKALARNCAVDKVSEEGGDAGEAWKDGRPVRVVRSYKMMKHFPKYAPHEGIRYDGIYKVVKYYPETGKSGFRVWKYLLRRDDPGPAPWEKGGKTYPIIYPDGYLEAEAEKRAQKEKKNTSTPIAKAKKRVLRESNTNVEEDHLKKRKILDSSVLEDSPPSKKRKTRSSKVTDSPPQTLLTPKRSKAKKSSDTSMSSPQLKEVNPFTIAKGAKSPKVKSPGGKGISKGGAGGELNAEEKSAIGLDGLNAKLWKQCMDVFKEKGKKQFISEVNQLFLCIICQEVAANPVTTKCQHNFCMSCLKLAFKSTGVQTCSHCRQDLSQEDMKCNESLKLALRTLMPGYDIGKK